MPKIISSAPSSSGSTQGIARDVESPVDPKFLLLDNAITHTTSGTGPFSSEAANNYYNAMTTRSILRKSTKEKKKSGGGGMLKSKLGKLKKNKNKHVPLVETVTEEDEGKEPTTATGEKESVRKPEKRSVSFESKSSSSPRSSSDDASNEGSTAGETSSDDSSSGTDSDDGSKKKSSLMKSVSAKLGVTKKFDSASSEKEEESEQQPSDMLQLTTDGTVHHVPSTSANNVDSAASGKDILEDLRDQSSVTRGGNENDKGDDGSDTTVRSSNSSNKLSKKNKKEKKMPMSSNMKDENKDSDSSAEKSDEDSIDKLKEELLSLAQNNDAIQDGTANKEDAKKNKTQSKLKEFESTLTNILKPSSSKDSSSLVANPTAEDAGAVEPSSSSTNSGSSSSSIMKPSSDSYSGIGSARSMLTKLKSSSTPVSENSGDNKKDASVEKEVSSDSSSIETESNGSNASGKESTPKKSSGLKSLVSKALPIKNNKSSDDKAKVEDDAASKASSKASSNSKASVAESVKISCDDSGDGSTEIELEIAPVTEKKSLKEKVAEKLSTTLRQNDDKSKDSTAISKKSLEQLITEALAVSDTPEHIAQYLMDHGGEHVIDEFLLTQTHADSRASDLNKVPVTSFEQPDILSTASSVTANSFSGNNKSKSVCSVTTEVKPQESGDFSIKTDVPSKAAADSDDSIKTEQESDVSIKTEQQPTQSSIKKSFSLVSAVTEIVNTKGNNTDNASDPAMDREDASTAASSSILTEAEDANNESTKRSIKEKIKEKLSITSNEDDIKAQDHHDETCPNKTKDQAEKTEKALGDDLGKSFDVSEAITRTTAGDHTSVSSLRHLMQSKQCEAITNGDIQCADEAEQLVKTTKYACSVNPIEATQEIMGEINNAVDDVQKGIKSSVKRFFGVFPTMRASGDNVEMILDDTKPIPPVTSFEQDLKLDPTESDLSDNSFYYDDNQNQEEDTKVGGPEKKKLFGLVRKKTDDFDDSSVISWKELASFSKEG